MIEHTHVRSEEVQMHLRAAEQSLQAIQKMMEAGQPCLSVVQQISGLINRLSDCRAIVAQDHIASCIRTAAKPGQEAILNEMELLLSHIIKSSSPSGSHH